MSEKNYVCQWCEEVSPGKEWTKATKDEYPGECSSDWNMENAEGGDTVVCPRCGAEDERSEVMY